MTLEDLKDTVVKEIDSVITDEKYLLTKKERCEYLCELQKILDTLLHYERGKPHG